MLGAGLDTRPYRLGLSGLRWFEVDLPSVLAYKRQRLGDVRPGVDLVDVAGDVCDTRLVEQLCDAGLDVTRSILWIAEGLFAFLVQRDIEDLLGRLRQGSCAGSEVLFDVPNLAWAEAGGNVDQATSALRKRGLKFGTNQPERLAQQCGFTAAVVHDGHPVAHYGRRVEPPMEQVPPGQWTIYFVHGLRSGS
jgi:methyltransferase (TIGR00027 family)